MATYEAKCIKCNKLKTATYNKLMNYGCADCLIALKRRTIEDAQNLAKLKNGFCLSDHYENNHTKLSWKCEKEHTWLASYNQIQSGNWCPICCKINHKKDSRGRFSK